MKKSVFGFLAIVALAVGLVMATTMKPAVALADPLTKVAAYQISCGTSATRLAPSTYPMDYNAFKFWVNSATTVYFGGSDVDTSTKGMPYCTNTTNCLAAFDSIDGYAREVYCRVAAGSVTVTVLAGKK